jgi:hypothetical protein
MKQLVANNIKKLDKKQRQCSNNNTHREWRIIRNIKLKLTDNEAIVTKADKGNTLIIINKDYNNKNNLS